MVISAVSGVTSPLTVTEAPKIDSGVSESLLIKQMSSKEIENVMGTESYVRRYFSDIPVMIEIAKCESHFRQLDSNGEIHRGIANNGDVGVMQINEFYHLGEAKAKSYDIYTLEGNTAYARELYEEEGTSPWKPSKACWGKSVAALENKDLAINLK